jgi:hypothetical protein
MGLFPTDQGSPKRIFRPATSRQAGRAGKQARQHTSFTFSFSLIGACHGSRGLALPTAKQEAAISHHAVCFGQLRRRVCISKLAHHPFGFQ